ncbi:MAG TPA: nucleoside triphosphate pyrophosphohydrolase family protein [Pseudoneobacillus sp.]|nr:nucleoside triphosphate pyrophosphohydrolase family protein [Pseudoneobacillus sp.]
MMTKMDFAIYQSLTQRTASKREDRIHEYIYGLNGEAGELTDYLKKVYFHAHPVKRNHIKKELGDVLWYLTRLTAELGFTLEEIAIANIAKLSERYPDGFSPDKSINRVEYNESTRREFF